MLIPAEDRQKNGEDIIGKLIKSLRGTQDASRIWQLDFVKLVCGELGGFRRGKHSSTLFHNAKLDVRIAVHGDDFVCLSDEDELNHIDSLLKSNYTAEYMVTPGFGDSDAKRFLLSNRVFRVGTYLARQCFGDCFDLRRVPLIIKESGCNLGTKACAPTTRDIARQGVCAGRENKSNSGGGRCNTIQICLR